MAMQEMVLVGFLGQDPEMRYLPSGDAVANFSLATGRKWTNRKTNEQQEETVWWRVSVFGKQAEACTQALGKGSKVTIKCRMRPDPDTGGPRVFKRNDGSYGANYEVTATWVEFPGRTGAAPAPGQYSAETEIDTEGIPF